MLILSCYYQRDGEPYRKYRRGGGGNEAKRITAPLWRPLACVILLALMRVEITSGIAGRASTAPKKPMANIKCGWRWRELQRSKRYIVNGWLAAFLLR